jgi:hypothetical protein
VYVAIHVAMAPDPARVQVVNVPAPLVVRLTVPVGVRAGVGEVSVTVIVQVVGWLTTIEEGVQDIVVVVVRRVDVTVVLPLLVR